MLVKAGTTPSAESYPVEAPVAFCGSAQFLAAIFAPWPGQEVLIFTFLLNLVRAAFWTEPDELIICITLARRAGKPRHPALENNQGYEKTERRENCKQPDSLTEEHQVPKYQQ